MADYSKDRAFLAAPDAEKHQFLMATDKAYAQAAPEDQNAFRAKFAPDMVGRAKAFLTAEPETPRPDYLNIGGPDLGKYVRTAGRWFLPNTNTELVRDVLMGAVPVTKGAQAIGLTKSQVIAPALERILYSGAQPLAESAVKGDAPDWDQAGKQAGSTAALEALMATLNIPRAISNARSAQPVVHQAANFTPPTPAPTLYGPTGAPIPSTTPPPAPIVFNRVGNGGAPTVMGGGSASVTPTTVTVQPPASGSAITGGSSPAAILQEPLARPATKALIPAPERGAVDIVGQRDLTGDSGIPTGAAASVYALNKIKALKDYLTPSLHNPMVP